VLLRDNETVNSFRLEKYIKHKGFYIFKLLGLNDINSATRYKDYDIILPVILKEYIEEFDDINNFDSYIGLKVFDEDGQYVGEIDEYYNFNGNIVFKIICEKKYYLINYNKEHVISENISQQKLNGFKV